MTDKQLAILLSNYVARLDAIVDEIEGYSAEEIETLEYPVTGELQNFVRELKEQIDILNDQQNESDE